MTSQRLGEKMSSSELTPQHLTSSVCLMGSDFVLLVVTLEFILQVEDLKLVEGMTEKRFSSFMTVRKTLYFLIARLLLWL